MGLLDIPHCASCGSSTEARTFSPTSLECSCGHRFDESLPTGGEVRHLKIGWKSLLRGRDWLDAYLQREETGRMVVAGCPECERCVTLAMTHPLRVQCTHCASAGEVLVSDGLVDALPRVTVSGESWGGGLRLEWTPHTLAGSSDGVSCPSCSGPVDAFTGRVDCPACRTTLYAVMAGGRRFLPGVHVIGDDEGRPVDGWLPVTEAIDYYRRHLELILKSRRMTRRLMLGVVGLGFAVVALGMALMVALVFLVPMFGIRIVGVAFAGICVVGLGGFAAMLITALASHRRARRELGLDEPPRFLALPRDDQGEDSVRSPRQRPSGAGSS